MGLLKLWLVGIGSIAFAFTVCFITTGLTPIEFWNAIEQTTAGNIIILLFSTTISITMLAIPLRLMKPR
ncbi:hypothetical protein [Virgibacillus halodenitrificans]|uniref:hypothetical protein n=1 Tax=Virgibacillus halodenitrificans TaxID=1482 RepID=UPI000EF44132|nr:hypothetical protein [Virgibacillus halodenitrificans]